MKDYYHINIKNSSMFNLISNFLLMCGLNTFEPDKIKNMYYSFIKQQNRYPQPFVDYISKKTGLDCTVLKEFYSFIRLPKMTYKL